MSIKSPRSLRELRDAIDTYLDSGREEDLKAIERKAALLLLLRGGEGALLVWRYVGRNREGFSLSTRSAEDGDTR